MSDSHEPSYYEIALTNRQVLFAFVILLVCLLATFVAGVWVGRSGEVQAASPPPGERLAESAAPAAGKNGEPLEKLSFFSPGADTTLREDLAQETPAAAPPAAVVPPAQSEPPPVVITPPAPSPPAASPPAPAATPAAAAPEPAAAAGGLVVQVFSSRDKEQAEKVVQRLEGGGNRAYLSPVEVSGRTMYRVRIGPFGDRAEAQTVADQVRRDFKLDTWITQ